MNEAESPLVVELLAWIASHPRTYAEVMEIWRTNCPRHSIWEDAVIGGLIQVVDGEAAGLSRVVLTPKGIAVLDEARDPG